MRKLKKTASILYVEDEKAIQDELADILESFCETLYTADDGFQGLELFNKYQPDIIVTDIKMPLMDGIEMSKKIKEINNNVPIIFTTAFSDITFFQEAIELQVEGYILKPINLDFLEKKILNIIEMLELKKELFEKEQMLLQTSKLASMGEMIGNIAHQWKQPLSIMTMEATNIKVDYALNDTISDESSLAFAQTILSQSQLLSQTMDDFRTFFNPNNNTDYYNIKDFLEKCIHLVSASFDSNMIQTLQDIDEGINAYGNANQLLQAIINILNNARDALKLASDLREKLVFIVTIKEDGNKNILIVIKDNAGGIPEKILPRIFEPYFSTKEQSGGTGLGLYITHTIITNNLKGTIKAENEIFEHDGVEYKGAKFTITLPLFPKAT